MLSQAQAPTILIVEDRKTLNESYQNIFRGAGYGVLGAFSGKEALQLAAQREPTLILLDLQMPRMNGLSFLQKYEPKRLHPKVKVIAFGNYDAQEDIDEAYRLGADRYVLKVWTSPKELLKIVKHMVAV